MKASFDAAAGLVVVSVRFHGLQRELLARLALDTGATKSMLNWDLAVLLGYDPAAAPGRIQITTASGVEFVPKIVVRRIDALGVTVTDFPVLCHTLPPSTTVDGLLGLDYFRRHRLLLDFRAGTIELG